MAQPKCPDCGVTGIEHIVSRESDEQARGGNPWFHVIHCEQCGHVYGVIAKHVFGPRGGPTLVVPERN